MSRVKRQSEHHLISASTILILSGFLIGLTVGKAVAEDISPYILCCGLAGFLAFIVLDHIGAQRDEQEDQEEQGQVHSRLDRHVMSQSGIGFVLPPADDDDESIAATVKSASTADLQMLDDLYDELSQSGVDDLPLAPLATVSATANESSASPA